MEKPYGIGHSTCDNCGKYIDRDSSPVTTEINQAPVEFCSKECDIERRANLALMNMTGWNAA